MGSLLSRCSSRTSTSSWDFLPPLEDADLPDEPPLRAAYEQPLTAEELDWSIQLDAAERIDALIKVDRQLCALEACKQQLLASIADHDSSTQHWWVEEVAAALRMSSGAARSLLAGAQQLTHRLPRTFELLRCGELGPGHAAAIVRGSWSLPDDLLPQLEERVLPHAGEQSVPGVKQSVARAVLALDPATAEQKHSRAPADRSVRLASSDHGMAWLMALLPAVDAKAMYARLDAAARALPPTIRGPSINCAPTLSLTASCTASMGGYPSHHGRQPTVEVLIPLTTLVGQDTLAGANAVPLANGVSSGGNEICRVGLAQRTLIWAAAQDIAAAVFPPRPAPVRPPGYLGHVLLGGDERLGARPG